MRRWIIPQIAWADLLPMVSAELCGAILAGMYRIVQDQLTDTISPEYFTKLKFDQFRWTDVGLAARLFVAQIGFLATWSVGFFCAWSLALRVIPGQDRSRAYRKILRDARWFLSPDYR